MLRRNGSALGRRASLAPTKMGRRLLSSSAPALSATNAEVAIVGAGIWGMSTAYQLKRRDPSLNIQVYEPRRGLATVAGGAGVTCDVAIVGAGIWGMSTAYQLKRRDPSLNVQVFEQVGMSQAGYALGCGLGRGAT